LRQLGVFVEHLLRGKTSRVKGRREEAAFVVLALLLQLFVGEEVTGGFAVTSSIIGYRSASIRGGGPCLDRHLRRLR